MIGCFLSLLQINNAWKMNTMPGFSPVKHTSKMKSLNMMKYRKESIDMFLEQLPKRYEAPTLEKIPCIFYYTRTSTQFGRFHENIEKQVLEMKKLTSWNFHELKNDSLFINLLKEKIEKKEKVLPVDAMTDSVIVIDSIPKDYFKYLSYQWNNQAKELQFSYQLMKYKLDKLYEISENGKISPESRFFLMDSLIHRHLENEMISQGFPLNEKELFTSLSNTQSHPDRIVISK
jgi:hypothetical protein